ncbi:MULTISPECIES: ABC transporter ATP-binding protein [unclassified Ruminococcus]|uniref:ABC transporter ATP-binding protein n=1 Tax=unclassified Ruminococcus TaxID=2608920 RepID=UPI0021093A34|nr:MULTISPECIES: ABC transporter ATP-binding protein [unclassified Ruminococcus]MCQ4022570.1 ATP-binding cassette domain-containing protein [Ruminococcus sp. zg-924]MCQ4114810.1 ATP-binding cassette domain-containing protein [Ruminococcus sp. zg-921]
MKYVFKELLKFKKELVLIVLTVIGTTLCTLGLPSLLMKLIDKAIPEKNMPLVFEVGGIMLLLVVIGVICGIITSRASATVSMAVGRNLRSRIFKKVQYFSQTEIDKFTASSLITRTNNDITQVQTFINQCLRIAVQAPIMCICGVILAISSSPSLSGVLVISIPLMAVVLVLIAKIAVPLSTKIQLKIDRINLVMREKLTGVRVIRAFGTSEFESDKFDKINRDYQKTNKKLQRTTNSVLPILTLILSFTAAMVMLMAANQSVNKGIDYTIGEVMAIIQYIMQIMVAVIMLTLVFILLPRAATAAARAKEVLDCEPVIKNKEQTTDNTELKGYLAFKDVSFTYPGADFPAIKNLSFEAKPGETTAIIGGTGMGKSTIVNLIPRLYDVCEGQVLVDGVDVRDYDTEVLRNKIGFVPQKAVLFSGTIDSNIAFGDENADEDRIEEAVKIAQSYDFIMKKEDGFNSPISQGGTNVSGGQRQRLAIARAIVRKPEIYVFDDSFSALDFKTDKALRTALAKETDNATVVIVAQRISTIMDADRIIVIEKGEVAGIGTHSELLKTCDVYKEIVSSQMSKEDMEK